MTNLAYAAFAAALATITCSAVADEMKMKGGEMGMMSMEMMDTNKDGMISEKEHMKMFTTMDKNKDGMMDAGEQEQMMMMSEEEGFIKAPR
ncbi:MAG: hypothetical protein ACR2KU_01385 [Gammaproteobacteria bacterium]